VPTYAELDRALGRLRAAGCVAHERGRYWATPAMRRAYARIAKRRQTALKELAAKPNGPHHMVVIGEDWCPDVYRGMPVAARIAEAAGIELRVFERDQNKDMIAEYLHHGEFESILFSHL
jgi:hypothetical protein